MGKWHLVGVVSVALIAMGMYRSRNQLFSFPAAGKLYHLAHGTTAFSMDEVVHIKLPNKVALVTGANVGLGQETAKRLWQAGATTIMMCRSPKKCAAARENLVAQGGGVAKSLIVAPSLDLSSLASVRAAAAWFREQNLPLHILVLNAGMLAPHGLTDDGIETSFQVNHLGHFLLVKLLENIVVASAPSRVVVVSSDAHYYTYPEGVRPNLASINDPTGADSGNNYGQSKMCNVLFMKALSRRLNPKGVYVNAVHPGIVASEFTRSLLLKAGFSHGVADVTQDFMSGVLTRILVVFDVEGGALTQIYASMSPEIERANISGRYFVPIAMEMTPDTRTENVTFQEHVWAMSEELVQSK